MSIRSQNLTPLLTHPERLVASLRLPTGNNVDTVIPAWVAVVDEAYRSEQYVLFSQDLYGTDQTLLARAEAVLIEAGFTVASWDGGWTKTHDGDGRHLGWRAPVERAQRTV